MPLYSPRCSNRWRSPIRIVFLGGLFILFAGIGPGLSQTSGGNQDIIGCWRGGQITDLNRQDEQYRLFTLRSDGSLVISLIFEAGVRSRVWEFDTDVTYEDPEISWLAHTGTVSADKDTMTVLKVWQGDSSLWIFTRYREVEPCMTQLQSAIGDVYEYSAPEQLDDGWVCADLADAGVDEEKMSDFIRRITQGKQDDIHSLLMVKNGKLILEEYFATKGKRFGPVVTGLFRNKVHHLASTTKSVLSALIGISIDRGQIKSVNEPIHPFLPHYSILFTEEKKQIQVKHMLTMTAGFEWEQFKYPWDDPRNNGTAMYRCGDVIAYVLGRPMASEPGETFTYSNGVPTVLGAVLKNACSMEADAFAEKVLFGPLGISKYLWTRYPDGSVETDGGLALCSRDLARIGQLFLNRGKWDGKQIVSENWIEESTKRRIPLKGFMSWGYGYHWMQVDMKYKGNMIHSYFVPGDGGQLLSVFPGLDMVIVFTAGNYGSDVKTVCYNMIYYYILPAVLTETE